MAPRRTVLLFSICCCLHMWQLAHGVSVATGAGGGDERAVDATATTYRVSQAKPQPRPSNRVPAHLQDIHHGVVYDDADDVIHIIEPPQHFQQLKRLIGQKGVAAVAASNQQPRKYSLDRSQSALLTAASPAKVTERRKGGAKVAMPPWQKPAPSGAGAGAGAAGDLLTQSSQMSQAMSVARPSQLPLGFPMQLPLEILASVRKTERLLQLPRRPARPYAKERVKTRKVQTVVMEKRFERDRNQHTKERRVGVERMRNVRTKRATTTNLTRSRPATGMGHDEQYRGTALLEHIDALLKSAALYLPAELQPSWTAPPPQQMSLIGEIEPTAPATTSSAAVGASNLLLQEQERTTPSAAIVRQRNATTVVDRCPTAGPNETNCTHARTRNMQATTTELPGANITETTSERRYGDRLRGKLAPALLLTNQTSDGRQRNGTRRSRNMAKTRARPEKPRARLNAAALLYEDVMTNIRHMLEANNLHELEEEPPLPDEYGRFADDRSARLSLPKDIERLDEFNELNGYLKELQRIVADLPGVDATKPARRFTNATRTEGLMSATATEISLNAEEMLRATKEPEWYVINGDGEVYGTNLTALTKPAAQLFHSFPDIPNAAEYVRNRSLVGNGVGTTIEILA